MRVTIKHEERTEETKHWFRPNEKHQYYLVYLYLELAETEKTILTHRKLWKHEVYSVPNPDWDDWDYLVNRYPDENVRKVSRKTRSEPSKTKPVTIADFVANPFIRHFGTPSAAKAYEEKLTAEYLPMIKQHIEENTELPKDKSFEL